MLAADLANPTAASTAGRSGSNRSTPRGPTRRAAAVDQLAGRRHRPGARQLRQHDLRARIGRGGRERHAVLGDRRGRACCPRTRTGRPHVPSPADRRGPGPSGDRVHRRSGGARASPRPATLRYAVLVRRRRVRRSVAAGAEAELARSRAARRRDLRLRLPHASTWRSSSIGSRAAKPDVLFVSAYLDDAIALRRELVRPARHAAREHRHVVQLLHAGVRLDVGQDAVGVYASDKPSASSINPSGLRARRAIAAPARERRVSRRSGIEDMSRQRSPASPPHGRSSPTCFPRPTPLSPADVARRRARRRPAAREPAQRQRSAFRRARHAERRGQRRRRQRDLGVGARRARRRSSGRRRSRRPDGPERVRRVVRRRAVVRRPGVRPVYATRLCCPGHLSPLARDRFWTGSGRRRRTAG